MSRNIEIKAKVDDFESFYKLAKDLCNGQEPLVLKQKDTFFKSANGRLKLREFLNENDPHPAELILYNRPDSDGPKVSTNGRLKLREFLNENDPHPAELIIYNRPDSDGPKVSSYVKTKIVDVKNLKETLALSNGIVGIVEKTRYLFLFEQTRIHLDNVKNLGTFMELEVCLAENTIEKGEEIAKDLMEKLGVKEADLVKGAYMDKLLENAGIPSQFSTTTIFDYGKHVLLKCYKVCKIAQTEKLLCSQQMLRT
uniref:CYTH domain-containing protein n=1 Tax=Panagrolaimus sp. JU765 TaxID=591449 RepID=A0AC34QKQ4_9BILA